MTDATLEQGDLLEKEGQGSSHWVRRTLLVTFCLLLLGTLCVVFTRVIAARVPEQRATLEKLITDRTGLAVRFDNVHFAWSLEGTSAVFTHVELTDPKAGRIRVVAPELRVEFDAWDFLRHQQFSLGHVTLTSPDIEIIGDAADARARVAAAGHSSVRAAASSMDERTLVRRFTDWAALMPIGRIEVEGARVHLIRRGDNLSREDFTLSQAVVSRNATSLDAFGTMLLAQDMGQSLFVSAKLESLGATSAASGELRVIARRVFLEKLALPGLRGQGTLDARIHLREGRIESGRWQASARELEMNGERGTRFDHFTVEGKLSRDGNDLLVDFNDLQLTRGARLERAPNVSARLSLDPGSLHTFRTTVRAERIPFMAAEFIAGLITPHLGEESFRTSGEWTPTAGELHEVRFDSGVHRTSPAGWTLTARVTGIDLSRNADRAEVTQLAAGVALDSREIHFTFDPSNAAAMRLPPIAAPRALLLSGSLIVSSRGGDAALRFEDFKVRSGDSSLAADGEWKVGGKSVAIQVANVDRALVNEAWTLLAREVEPPSLLPDIAEGSVVAGSANLVPVAGHLGDIVVDWRRSDGKLQLANLVMSGQQIPHLSGGRGTFAFAHGTTQLDLNEGMLEELSVSAARLDWPRSGTPRLRATMQGPLSSPLLRRTLVTQGLDRLQGGIAVEVDARGEKELANPELWRVTAQISDASLPLGEGIPRIEKLAGIVRYADRQLLALSLNGSWFGGPVALEARRTADRALLSVSFHGSAESEPLLRLLGRPEWSDRINGQLAWIGTAQRLAGDDAWQLTLAGNLAGVESRLPSPYGKARARPLALSAALRVDAQGVRDFQIESGRDVVRGQVRDGAMAARFEVQGIAGEVRQSAAAHVKPTLELETLETRRAPELLAAAAAVLPVNMELSVNVGDLRQADRSIGPMLASLVRRESGVEFAFDSPGESLHQLRAHGTCATSEARCRVEFAADTRHLATLLRGAKLPAEWPAESMHAEGELSWPMDTQADITDTLAGKFDIETQGADSNHVLSANATLADGQIQLANVQGSGPAPTQVFRGTGRVGLLTRDYDLTVDYEQVSLAATAVPTPARAKLTRVWNTLRGTVARRGWTDAPESKRVQWRGFWD
jgi:hypothetical protein